MARYLHLFQNQEEHANNYYGANYFEPWVGCDVAGGTITLTVYATIGDLTKTGEHVVNI